MQHHELTYQSPAVQSRFATAAVVLLWLWAVLNAGAGLLIIFFCVLSAVIPDFDYDRRSFVGLLFLPFGLLPAAWGVRISRLAIALHQRRPNTAAMAYEATRAAGAVWIFLWVIIFLAIFAMIGRDLFYSGEALLLPLIYAIPFLVVLVAIGMTMTVLRRVCAS